MQGAQNGVRTPFYADEGRADGRWPKLSSQRAPLSRGCHPWLTSARIKSLADLTVTSSSPSNFCRRKSLQAECMRHHGCSDSQVCLCSSDTKHRTMHPSFCAVSTHSGMLAHASLLFAQPPLTCPQR